MSKLVGFLKKIDVVNTSFLLITPVIGIGGVIYLLNTGHIHWATVVLAVIFAIGTGLGITAGYHRLFAHKSYSANSLVKIFLLIVGAAAFQNSARRWASDHRRHHKFVDTNDDPYNIQKGFWWAHMGWVMVHYDLQHRYNNVADLEQDKWVMWQEKYYVPLGIAASFGLPTLLASLWGDPLGGFLIAGFLRLVLNHHFTFSINSFCHMIGTRTYNDRDSSRDNWFLALVTYGEGYHNFHHKFPTDYRNGIRFYHWDPTKWFIKFLSWIGYTYDLKKIPTERILRARLLMEEKKLMLQIDRRSQRTPLIPKEFVASARARLETTYAQFRALRVEYHRLREEKMHQLDHLRKDLEETRAALHEAIANWAELCQSFGVRHARFYAIPSFE